MPRLDDATISRAIHESYGRKFADCIRSDVLIAGAGPSGLTAAAFMASRGLKVTLLEKRLAPGGGVWGGGMAMNDVIVQEEALPVLDEFNIRHSPFEGPLHVCDAVELAAGLTLAALQAGANILNLMTIEDTCLYGDRVAGLVVNRTMISGALHVDPVTFASRATLDGTGHDAVVVATLRRRGLLKLPESAMEMPMNATEGERFVVEKTGEAYPGLWVSGMSVCATYGGPRMGPIFGGMLLSGKKVAEGIVEALAG